MTWTMLDLHRAGAEIGRAHGEAWARLPDLRTDPAGVLARIAALHQRLGRRVTPCDLRGQPLSVCAGGDQEVRPPTPGQLEHRDTRSLTDGELARLIALRSAARSRRALALELGVNEMTLTKVLAGGRAVPAVVDRLLAGAARLEAAAAHPSSPDGDSDPAALADAPGQPQPGAAPGRATTPPRAGRTLAQRRQAVRRAAERHHLPVVAALVPARGKLRAVQAVVL